MNCLGDISMVQINHEATDLKFVKPQLKLAFDAIKVDSFFKKKKKKYSESNASLKMFDLFMLIKLECNHSIFFGRQSNSRVTVDLIIKSLSISSSATINIHRRCYLIYYLIELCIDERCIQYSTNPRASLP